MFQNMYEKRKTSYKATLPILYYNATLLIKHISAYNTRLTVHILFTGKFSYSANDTIHGHCHILVVNKR